MMSASVTCAANPHSATSETSGMISRPTSMKRIDLVRAGRVGEAMRPLTMSRDGRGRRSPRRVLGSGDGLAAAHIAAQQPDRMFHQGDQYRLARRSPTCVAEYDRHLRTQIQRGPNVMNVE